MSMVGMIIIMRDSPEASSPNRVPRIEFGAGRGRQGQAIPTYCAGQVPETSSGQVMTAEKKI
jgi:hypothetical protein